MGSASTSGYTTPLSTGMPSKCCLFLFFLPRSIVLKGFSLVRTGEAHARSYHTDGDSWVFMREGLVGGNQNHGGK